MLKNECVRNYPCGCYLEVCTMYGCVVGRVERREHGKLKRLLKKRYPQLVQGYYIFAIVRDESIVYVGTARGNGEDRFSILTLQRKCNGCGAIILADCLREEQARYYKRKLIWLYQPCENIKKETKDSILNHEFTVL